MERGQGDKAGWVSSPVPSGKSMRKPQPPLNVSPFGVSILIPMSSGLLLGVGGGVEVVPPSQLAFSFG